MAIQKIPTDMIIDRVSGQTLKSSLADIASDVKSKGAKGDGTTDDTTVIQTTINESTNKKVFLPDGTYKISSALLINNYVKIEGQSRNGTVLLIDSTSDIDAFQIWKGCEISNLTVQINNPNHTKAAFKLMAKVGGCQFGKINNIKVQGSGYTNQTKAIEIAGDPSAVNYNAYFDFWDFKDFVINYCYAGYYTEADFTKVWMTACTFENFVLNYCIRGVYFNTTFLRGYYSRMDCIGWQFQAHAQMQSVFDSPSDRSIVDIHVWDKSFYAGTPKAFNIKGYSTNNTFKIRNLKTSEVQFEKFVTQYQNKFDFSDEALAKTVFVDTTIYVDGATGNDLQGDGSQTSPYKTIMWALSLIPRELWANVTLQIADGAYNENVSLPGFTGNGLLTVQGTTAAGTKINSLNVTRNSVVSYFKNMTVQNVSSGIAVLQADSELCYFDDVYIVPNGVTPTYGYFIQNSRSIIRGTPQITGCVNAINSSGSDVVVYAVSGTGNTNGLSSVSGSIVYRTAIPGGFATNNFVNTFGGSINHRLSGFGLTAIQASTTSIVVTHNLGEQPNFFNITPQGNVGYVWASSPTTTQFTINCSVAPGSAVQIGWEAKKI